MRLASAMTVGLGQYILQNSPMASLNSALRALNGTNEGEISYRIRQLIAGYTGFIIPNFFNQIDKFSDPTLYSANDLKSYIIRNIPFVRGNALVPSLNLFGDKIDFPPSERFVSFGETDQEAAWLANNNLNISKPNRPVMVDYKTGKQHDITEQEYYKLIKHFGPRFREALRFAIPRMNNLTHEQKKERVTQLKSDAYEYAKFMLYKETNLRAETKEKAEDIQAWFERKNSGS